MLYYNQGKGKNPNNRKVVTNMTNYTFTFETKNTTTTIVKAFATYKEAENFKTDYFAKHFDVIHSSMKMA